jgi:hypothetical protein
VAPLYSAFLGLICIAPASFASTAPDPSWDLKPAARVIAIGDLHGDLGAFVSILRSRELIDDKGAWKGGKTNLVITGDTNDRGPDTRYIMDYLMRLQKESTAAGGKVSPLLGNHEVMVTEGDVRYTRPEESAAFDNLVNEGVTKNPAAWKTLRDSQNRHLSEADLAERIHKYEAECAPKEQQGETCAPMDPKERELRLRTADEMKAYEGIAKGFFGNSPYAEWNASRAAIVKVGDTLFMHGGVGPWLLKTDPGAINKMIRGWMKFFQGTGPRPAENTAWVLANDGPLWTRELARENVDPKLLDAILKKCGVKRVVVSHTPGDGVRSLYGGKAYVIDTGNSAAYGGSLSSVEIKGPTVEAKYTERSPETLRLRERLIAEFKAAQGNALPVGVPAPAAQAPVSAPAH